MEREARDEARDDARLLAARSERPRPVLESFGDWQEGEAVKVLPRSPLGEAISQTRSNWVALARCLDEPHLSIDSNATERAIRPIALGRQSWLPGGRRSCWRLAAARST